MLSRKTIVELVKALHFRTHNEIDQFALLFDLDNVVSGEYIKEKETSIARHLNANPDATGPNGSNLTVEVVEHLVENYHGFDSVSDAFPTLAHCLDRDGYELASEGLRRKLPPEIPLAEQQNQFVRLLEKHEFDVAKRHYDQALAAHARGEWAASNAQLRSLVEEFFDRAYSIVCPGSESNSNARRIALAKAGFFVAGYNEFLFNGTGFVEAFWKRLHPEGSHPGLSEQDDSTFRYHLVVVVLHFFINRLDQRIENA